MRNQIQQLITRLQEAADQLRTSDNLMSETLHGIADGLESAIQPQWVPVGERLPNNRRFVFAESDDGVSVYYHSAISGWCFNGSAFYGNVVRWHEIDYPQPPAN